MSNATTEIEHCTTHGLFCLGLGEDCSGPAADVARRARRAAGLDPLTGRPPKPLAVVVGQRWVHAGTPELVHVVAEVDDGWTVFAVTYGCVPTAHLLSSDRWHLLEAVS